jgi:hypothetical protein
MDGVEPSAAIYSEAKSEYTRQLICSFQPVLLRFFLDRYNEIKAAPKTKSTLSEFQDSLSQIPEWNLDKVQRETTHLLSAVNCDYVEDLITAVFIAHTKILSAIRLQAKPRRRINITVPKPDHFMHRTLSECSRLLWANVYLFGEGYTSLERQKNINEASKFIEEGILQAIRNLLPVKSILRDSLQEDDDDGIHVQGGEEAQPEAPTPSFNETPKPLVGVETPSPETLKPTMDLPGVDLNTISPVDLAAEPVMTSEAPPDGTTIVKTEEAAPAPAPEAPVALPTPVVPQNQTLVVDTEKSVAFTGMDTVFGLDGAAEVQQTIEEHEDEDDFKILDDSEPVSLDEFEDLDAPAPIPEPLAVGDYETL